MDLGSPAVESGRPNAECRMKNGERETTDCVESADDVVYLSSAFDIVPLRAATAYNPDSEGS